MFFKRHQQTWKNRSSNAILYVNATQNDIKNIYQFCQQYNDYLSQFVFNAIEMQKNIKYDDSMFIVDNQQNLNMVIEILKQQKFIFIDIVNQTKTSYKGYISYIIISTYNKLYLIDSARLHDKCYGLKQVLQRKSLIKFMHQCQQVLNSLKRDFQIFMPNIFDLQVVQRYLVKKGKLSIFYKQKLKQYIYYNNSNQISIRPQKQEFLVRIKQYYQQEMSFLINLDKFFSTEDPEYQCYAYFNNYQLLGKSYFHHVSSVYQIDQMLKAKNKAHNNPFSRYTKHTQPNFPTNKQSNQNLYYVKTAQQQEIAQLIFQWRQHMAKIKDTCAEELLSYQIISKLSKSNITSVFQISQMYSTQTSLRPYLLSIQELQQILELFHLYNQQKQQANHELNIPRRLPFYKSNQQKPIKQLFEQLKFNDATNDWLNKKNDESVKLYKQIVSINQFDNSIVEEYLKENQTKDIKSSQTLPIQEINKYIKYAQYLRNGNHKKLQQLYEKSGKNKHQHDQDDEYQENFIQGEQFIDNCREQLLGKNWDDIQNQINFPTMHTINQIKSTQSLTSINSRSNLTINSNTNFKSNLTINSCKILSNNNKKQSLKQNKLNSLNLIQSSIFQNKIQPLPENIQNIYLQAAKAKKTYATKGLKKNNKTGKKEVKNNTEMNNKNKKDEEFIPKKEQIFNLIHY